MKIRGIRYSPKGAHRWRPYRVLAQTATTTYWKGSNGYKIRPSTVGAGPVPALAPSQSPVSFECRPADCHYGHFLSQWRATGSWKLGGEYGFIALTTKFP